VLARERRWTVWFISADADSGAEAAELGASGLALEWHGITRAAVRKARRRSLQLIAWTIRDEPTLDLMRGLGVDGLCAEGAALSPTSRPSAAPE
jgi:glycerophosphoryl diester phosphodiesterase